MRIPALFLFACSLAVSAVAAEPSATTLLQFRLVVTNATADSESVVLTTKLLGREPKEETLQVLKKPEMDGSAVKSALAERDNLGRPTLSIKLTDSGTEQFARFTREHLHERLAIFVNGKIQSAPVIYSEIPNGEVLLTGDFTKADVNELAKKLNAGAKK